jgi:hypothetical protein
LGQVSSTAARILVLNLLLEFTFPKKQRLTARVSYINIFNRVLNYKENKKDDFGSVSFSMAIKLF